MAHTKAALRDELTEALRAELDAVMRAHKATTAAATHEEAKPENDKDTRALEQSYLARGQAIRVRDLEVACAEVAAMNTAPSTRGAIGALVSVSEDDASQMFFLAPHGGGTRLADGAVQVVTPQSPIGRALVGKSEGDVCEVVIAGKTRELEIVHVE